MITRNNIKDVILQISNKDKYRIKNTNKEYIVLRLHITNSSSYTEVICTNNFTRYQYVSNNGDCILESNDIIFDNII